MSMKFRCPYRPPAKTQKGAVLVTGLLILLVLTILGISNMSGSALQERMAGNDRDRQVGFQAAEAALRHAEDYVRTSSLSSTDFDDDCESPAGHCNPKPSTTEQWMIAANWTDNNKHRTYSLINSEAKTSPKYIIEYLGKQILPPATAPCPACNDIYRITALGTGTTDQSRVMLQSVYVRSP